METYPTSPTIQFVFTQKMGFKTLISNFENGYEQRRKKWAHGKHSFSVKYDTLTLAEVDTLYDFYVARNGSHEAFYFANPVDTVTYTVRFADDEMSLDVFTLNLSRTGLNLIEVF